MTKTERTFVRLAALLAALIYSAGGWCQSAGDFTYTHLGQAEGLHSQRIYSIVQTADGALWWSSKSGVERYNGVSISHYLPGDATAYSDFAGKFIKLCGHCSGPDGLIPVDSLFAFDNKGTVYRYNATHDTFQPYADMNGRTDGYAELNDILPTPQGVWMATNQGILFLRNDSMTAVRRGVHANYIVRTARSLLFCTREGVLQYMGASPTGAPHASATLRTIDVGDAESGYYDHIYNKVWLGGYSSGIRVLTLDEDGGVVRTDAIAATTGGIHNPVRAFCPYDESTMLIGVDGMGVLQAGRTGAASPWQAHVLFNANEGTCGVLHGNGVYAVLRDRWGNIVTGTYSGGIDVARPVGTTTAIFRHERGNSQSVINDRVNCLAQYDDHTLIMGTDDGVSIYDRLRGTWQHTCRGAVVLDLLKTPRGTMLAATYGKGVLEFRLDGSYSVAYTKGDGILDDDHVYRLFTDRDGSLWMGCLDGSLVHKTPDGTRRLPISYVKDMAQLPDGRMAIATAFGIYLADPTQGTSSELYFAPPGEHDVNRYVHTLYVNDGRELWIGTDGGGLYIYDLGSAGRCRHLTTADGLPSNFVNSIVKDTLGRIMLATERGLAFTTAASPTRIVGVNYCYGVDREYTTRSAITLNSGHIMFGSTTGAIIIDPGHIQEIDYTARLNIRGIRCDADDDAATAERMQQMVAGGNVGLGYAQRTFELLFESINLRNQSDIACQYQVDDGDWSMPTSQQYIRFTNMEPGRHQVRLRSVSRTCGAVLDEAVLTISIAQPWWNSWWMWMLYCGIVVLAFYGAWRVYQLHTKYMRLVVSNPNLALETPPATGRTTDNAVSDTAGTQADSTPTADAPATDTPDAAAATDTPAADTPADSTPSADTTETAEGREFIDRATRHVIDNITDSSFTIDHLCREMAMSRTLFYVKLKSYTGKSPQDFIRVIRLERAAVLLRNGRPVTDAAALSGFDNPKYFSTVFKKYFGVSPSKYQ